MYQIIYSQGARKALKRLRMSGSFPNAIFKELLTLFMCGRSLPIHFKDHALHGNLSTNRECHIGFNLLVVYERDDDQMAVTISKVGTHGEIFGE